MDQVEEEIHEARVYQMEQSASEGRYFQDQAKLVHELSNKLLSVEIQLGTVVFENQVRKEVKANFTPTKGTDPGSTSGK